MTTTGRGIDPAKRADLDQDLAFAIDSMVARAAMHDGKDLIEANVDFVGWLKGTDLNRAQLAAAVAALALRLHRGGA